MPAIRCVSRSSLQQQPRSVAVAASGSCPAGFSPPPPPPLEDETSSSSSIASRRAKELQAVASLPRPTGNRMRFIPFVGETQAHLRDHAAWAFERVWRHGPVFRSSLYGMKGIVVATDFASIEKVMSNEHVLTEWFQVRKEERSEREKRERREKLDVAPRDLAKRQSFFLNLKKNAPFHSPRRSSASSARPPRPPSWPTSSATPASTSAQLSHTATPGFRRDRTAIKIGIKIA